MKELTEQEASIIVGRFIELTDAYVYMGSINEDEGTLKILSDKIGGLITKYPYLIIPDIVLSSFVKNFVISTAEEDGLSPLKELDAYMLALMDRLKAVVPTRVKNSKEFAKKSDSILNEVNNILSKEDDGNSEQ